MRYARHPAVLWRSTSLGPVVLIPGKDDPDQLGGLAAVVWEVLDDALTTAEVTAAVGAIVGEAPDLSGALADMEAARLVTSSP
ncbi:MAG: hypothetical protein ABL966_15745 [Acidimicrobiales bacterium]